MTFKYIMQCKDTDLDIRESITRLQKCILKISNGMIVNSFNYNGDEKTEIFLYLVV